jgi:hypothetical protein
MKKDEAESAILAKIIIYDTINSEAIISPIGTWCNTFMFRRLKFINTKYENEHHEDVSVTHSIINSCKSSRVYIPYLFIYVYHGNNLSGFGHIKITKSKGKTIPEYITNKLDNIMLLNETFSESDIDVLKNL